MSFLKKPFRKLRDFSNNSASNSSDTLPGKEDASNGSPIRSTEKVPNGSGPASGTSTPDPRRRSRDLIQEERYRRSMDKERIKLEQKRRQQLARIESENFLKEGPEDITKLYRPFSMNMSKYRNHEKRTLFKELDFASQ
jgi:aspartyl-tRNA synthetase